MCSCPFTCRHRQTPLLERNFMEHISRLKICYGYSIHNQAKAIMLILQHKFGEFTSKDNCNAFLAYCLHFTLVSDCKITKCFRHGQIKIASDSKNHRRQRVILASIQISFQCLHFRSLRDAASSRMDICLMAI